ncbi:FAD-binding oxidoreductase [Luteimonas aestuarii]|uniref:FAD-binding oxidoreductase n=1 Tax=Luteimonas aestuarii TaxID=453837 RepID=A0A4R5TXQ2_9GAMM|nr:FAD-dependent oxidoreductase [Luteimonas aestuarii]TDK25987.1 FAD-binding oxidoreductase [Luteimonas aestuarii]
MDLKSGYPYWAVRNGLMQAFPPLQQDARCDVLVVGGGITGALVADELARHGHDVMVVEQRDVGWGSSAASTGLLQYEIDTHMVDLAREYGEDAAVQAYRACADAIPALEDLARSLRGLRDAGIRPCHSLYFASKRRHRGDLWDEFELRARHGFDVVWFDREPLVETYGVDAPAAILSRLGASIDPYRMAYRLLARLERQGAAIHDRTRIDDLQVMSRSVLARTGDGHAIRAGHVVFAAGYANQKWLDKRVAANRSSYAFITDPIDADMLGKLRSTMVWESARPYLYLRPTEDDRLLVGGEDDAVDVPAKRDARVEKKARKLLKRVQHMFPHLPLQPAFSWAGTFAETKDGLPYFGAHPQHGPRALFAMAYGGNGITYSMAGAPLLRALIERRRHALASLFSFDRA